MGTGAGSNVGAGAGAGTAGDKPSLSETEFVMCRACKSERTLADGIFSGICYKCRDHVTCLLCNYNYCCAALKDEDTGEALEVFVDYDIVGDPQSDDCVRVKGFRFIDGKEHPNMTCPYCTGEDYDAEGYPEAPKPGAITYEPETFKAWITFEAFMGGRLSLWEITFSLIFSWNHRYCEKTIRGSAICL